MTRREFPTYFSSYVVVRAATKTFVRTTLFVAASCLGVMASAPSAQAQEVTFHKTRYSSVKQPKESDVALTVTGSKVVIKGKKENGVSVDIPFSAIDAMSYEMAARHRVQEGAGVMLLSPGVGAILMATKTKSHWLDIEYHEGDAVQEMILRLDKSEYENVLSTLEARTGKHIARLDSKSSPLNPTAESKDMDEVVPFRKEGVVAALKSAMESFGCKVTDENAKHIECKRARGMSDRTGNGGEKVTAELQAEGDQTRVRIRTFKGTLGRLEKKNWSKPIFEEMMKRLPQPAVSASVGGVD